MGLFTSVNKHLKFCPECKEWYDPKTPKDWVTAHICPSQRHKELLNRIDKLERLLLK